MSSEFLIGIGAGDDCDGQVRVTADLLGMTPQQPPFSPPLLNGRQLCVEALRGWINQHRSGSPTTAPPQAEPDC
jgi:3-methyl-2-oxobutanoate hydroxymethyltransferase